VLPPSESHIDLGHLIEALLNLHQPKLFEIFLHAASETAAAYFNPWAIPSPFYLVMRLEPIMVILSPQ